MKKLVGCFCLILMLAIMSCKTEVGVSSDQPASPPKYTITYVDGDGKEISTQAVEKSAGEKGVTLKAEKVGYKASKYVGEDKKEITGAYKITKDTRITVIFTAITYTVKFAKGEATGEDVKVPDDIKCTYDTEFTLPENTLTPPEGKRADGWKTPDGKVIQGSQKNLTTTDGATITLTAHFQSNTSYTVNFTTDRGTAPASVTLNKGDATISLIEGSYKLADQTGYTFSGWYNEEQQQVEELTAGEDTVYEDYTLTAKWEPWTATIKYKTTDLPDTTVTWGQETSLSTATKEGHKFIGWSTSSNPTTSNIPSKFTWESTDGNIKSNGDELELYPVWKEMEITVTIETAPPTWDGITDIQLTYNKEAANFSAVLEGGTGFKWYIDGKEQEKEVSDTMSIYKVPEGTHTVTVTATKGGIGSINYSATMVVKTATSESI